MFLIIGSQGQLASELRDVLGDRAICVGKDELDISNPNAVRIFFEGKQFDAIINCAAYTAVDKAENDFDLAKKVNVDGARNLAELGIPIVHISTDYVFSGTSSRPYVESDKPDPQSVYGKTKLAGERAVLDVAKTAVIIRTSWVYSTYGNNFVKTMRRLGGERSQLNVVFDQIGSPTYALDLATAIAEILPQIPIGTKAVYHYSNEGVCSWYDFACAVMELSGLNCTLSPIESKDYPTPAKRPFYSVLNKSKIKKDFKLSIPYWKDALTRCISKF